MMTNILTWNVNFPGLFFSPEFKWEKKRKYGIFLRINGFETVQSMGIAISEINNNHLQKL